MPNEGIKLHKALLYERMPDGSARCGVCMRRCIIPEGGTGICKTRVNHGGDIYSTIYGIISSIGIDPIEKKPVYHYLPGTLCFSMGTFGCNFRCSFCQNWEIAYADGTDDSTIDYAELPPERAVELAAEKKCRSISWTYNEPSIWLEYTLDCAKLASPRGIRTIYVTNGYMTPEALDMIGPYLNVFRVDIKSMSNEFYRELIKVPDMSPILANTKRAKNKWHMHVEAVTNIIPGWNDSEENISSTAGWIHDNLGELTPWHITRFFPHADMADVPPTPPATLEMARQIAVNRGLKHVFIGNIDMFDDDTHCPKCGKTVIKRAGYNANVLGLDTSGRCIYCGSQTGVINS